MNVVFSKEKLLMLVKAYPNPSKKYGETVCTGAIRLKDKTWIRLYPYPFRVKSGYQFRKWDIVELPIVRSIGDPRPDSYRPYDLVQYTLTDHIDSADEYWSPRMPYIRSTAVASVEELLDGALKSDGTWGPSILPVPISSDGVLVTWEKKGEWSSKQEVKLERARQIAEGDLFNPIRYRKLKPKPYLFRLSFRDLTGEEYTYPILDWEIYQLYFNVRAKARDDAEALEKVRYKIEEQIFTPDREVFIILGSIHQKYRKKNLFAVDGFIWPKRRLDVPLFQGE